MYTKSDKEFMQQLNTEQPETYERIMDIHRRSQSDLRIGCHDISNIIALIYGNYQLITLKHTELSTDSRWNTLGDDIRYLVNAMKSIGEYRYSESVELSTVNADTYIADTINCICDNLSIPASQITINTNLLSCRINVDQNKIAFVLKALIFNILQIELNAHITLNAIVSENKLYISISDTLGGLPDNIGARLFEPFNTNKSTCIGLSLATSYRILLAHSGELTYIPNDNNGSTFTLILPVTS